MIAALSGGSTAALAASPIELIMIQQQLHGGSLPSTSFKIVQSHGWGNRGLMRGLGPTVMRDGIYVLGLLGVTPVLEAHLSKHYHTTAAQSSFMASLVGGIACALVSHPADIVKTCMQGDLKQKNFCGPVHTLQSLWRAGGISRIYRGAFTR